jgi:hypothetical protein
MKEASDLDVQRAINRVNMALLESDVRALKKQTSAKLKSRSKASDISRMNPIYKPKASPGPIGSSANVREGRSPDRSPKPNRANVRENRLPKTTPNANTREGRLRDTLKSKPKAKPAKNIAGFKPGTPGYKAAKTIKGMGKDLKKAYQGR